MSLLGYYFQSCMFNTSTAISIRACPQLMCIALECEYGSEPVKQANGCPGCRQCIEKPVDPIICEELMCVALECEYGSVPTTQANGCPGCNQCIESATA